MSRFKACGHCRAVRHGRKLEADARARERARARAEGVAAPAWAAIRPPRPRYLCDRCVARIKERARKRDRAINRRRVAKRRRLGLCKHCAAPAMRGVFCGTHADRNAAQKRASDARRKAAGLCISCTKPIHRNGMCKKHWLKRSLYMMKYAPEWKAKRAGLALTG